MSRVRIRINVLGQMPRDFDPQALVKWESSIFQIDHMETFQLYEHAAGPQWEFTDEQLAKHFRGFRQEHILVVLVSVRLQCNWYLRRMTNDRIVFTFHETAEILRSHDVPLANIVLRVLYAAALIYLRYENRIPPASEPTDYAHDETRGCLFDMNAYKSDIIHSCHRPRMCAYCVSQWQRAQVSNETIASVQREIKGSRKPLLCTIAEFRETASPLVAFDLGSYNLHYQCGEHDSWGAALLTSLCRGDRRTGLKLQHQPRMKVFPSRSSCVSLPEQERICSSMGR